LIKKISIDYTIFIKVNAPGIRPDKMEEGK
jgi:hypothetical protein